jgi:hypothetical protein
MPSKLISRTSLALTVLLCGSICCAAAASPDSRDIWWSLKPLSRPEIPKAKAVTTTPVNPIDAFIWAKLQEKGLSASPEADRPTLIRRLSFDLTGLPPTPQEVEAYVCDKRLDAYERLVERLLASPQYGERWGRHWLDVARYTESQGFEYDHPRDNGWHYRDYVIRSFNKDKPYDLFMKEQIAGDVLEPITTNGVIATSFLVCGPWDQAGSGQANVVQRMITREEEMEDTISVVAQTFLGFTVNCARCHAHKFDPIPQEDYYRLKAVFEGVRHGERAIATPGEIEAREAKVAPLKKQLSEAENLVATKSIDESKRKELRQEIETCKKALAAIPAFPVTYAGIRKQPEPTHLLKRGDVKTPEEVMTPGALSAIKEPSADFNLSPDSPEAQRRAKLAEWLSDPRNPLPARVMMNRLWHYHFGQGIVTTPNDFGASGARPSHPALLDWLASRFIESGWSIKEMQRLIVTSATYRQSSEFNAQAARIDANNQLLWRFAPQRMEAEVLRDCLLFVCGELNPSMGGPSFRPFDTKVFGATSYFPTDKIGPQFNRRTVYRMNINSGKDPMLDSFDCPDPGAKTPRRGVTTTPLQALNMMNSSFVQRQAARMSERIQAETHGKSEFVAQAYQYCFARLPSDQESAEAAALMEQTSPQNFCWALLNSTEFLYVR